MTVCVYVNVNLFVAKENVILNGVSMLILEDILVNVNPPSVVSKTIRHHPFSLLGHLGK